ncbi:MAG: decarboxylating NADP(+)-dependent phosphogluconate dehydrogenase [Actinobacteria bacterium]|nr:decarboxylating NADP(+)-dependent phosphogluconate dehydrogenase [Actinomycetota bacterium]
MSQEKADIGLIGLAVMGQNLVLNMADHGFSVAVYNRTISKTDAFTASLAPGTSIFGTHHLTDLTARLSSPRIVMLMVRAGRPVDATIDALIPHLEPRDIIIDGGNSNYEDTRLRVQRLEALGIHFVGAGVSGGEEGARTGPSIMPGGAPEAWPHIKNILQSIAAVYDGEPCCDWLGPGGAGHFVKTVHNGIEYGDMQVIAEAYDIMRRGLAMDHDAMAATFDEWGTGALDSYLIDITATILRTRDTDGEPLLTKILDTAGQKGTGRWTVDASMDFAMPVSLVAEAVHARIVSALIDDRYVTADALGEPSVGEIEGSRVELLADLHSAAYAAKIVSYAQGFMLLSAASREHMWDLDMGLVASLWRDGCIIRSQFLNDITSAYRSRPDLPNLLVAPYFVDALTNTQDGLRRTVARAALAGLPTPAYSSALAFLDAFRTRRLPANLLQAQRDYFGAHTYERVDRPRGEFFHTNWTGTGGDITSTTYDA